MGSGTSVPASVEVALVKGFSQEEIDAYLAKQKEGATGTPSADKADPAPAGLISAARQMVQVFFSCLHVIVTSVFGT